MIRKLWTDEKPKTSGYYWHKNDDGEIYVVLVKRGRVLYLGDTMRFECKLSQTGGKWSEPIHAPSLHRANKHESALKELTLAVVDCLAALDIVMKEPESADRGRKIAAISNALNRANDTAMHFGLSMEFNAINALQNKRARLQQRTGAGRGHADVGLAGSTSSSNK